jgi:integrase
MRGNLTRRGKRSWRIKLDVSRDPVTGKRDTRYITVNGTKREAEEELARLLVARDANTFVAPSKVTVAVYLAAWIDTAERLGIGGKTAQRYRELIDKQIVPHLGARLLQKLKPADLVAWHGALLSAGAVNGGPLAPRTVGHAHRVLHKALADAVSQEVLSRNVAAVVRAPKVPEKEMVALTAVEVRAVVAAVKSSVIYPHVVTLLSTGMRRGELMGLQWSDVDLDTGRLRIERAVEKTRQHGLRTKAPKTEHGRRTIRLPAAAVEVLKQHRKEQLELRVALGLGKLLDSAFVFGDETGAMRDPDTVTRAWRRCVASRGLPNVPLHSLRHSHASALIAGKHDPVVISRRLGHGNPAITMKVYAHLFNRGDDDAAATIDTVLSDGK